MLPFSSLSTRNDGVLRVCCNNYTYPRDSKGNELTVAGKSDIADLFNNKLHRDIRSSMLKGEKHASCQRCWDNEKNGGRSFRHVWNDIYGDKQDEMLSDVAPDGTLNAPRFYYMDITFGNNCNLRCRMCNPVNSKLLIPEDLAIGITDKNFLSTLPVMDWYQLPQFMDIFRSVLPHLDRLNFLGGEPLFVREHMDLLAILVKEGRAPDIEIQYNTNLSQIPERLYDLWRHFKRVNVGVSVDGVGRVNEFIRYPSTWDNLIKNIHSIAHDYKGNNIALSIHSTIQIYNIMNWGEILQWVARDLGDLGFHRVPYALYVGRPEWFDACILPTDFKQRAYDKVMESIAKLPTQLFDEEETAKLSTVKSLFEHIRQTTPPDRDKHWQKFLEISRGMDKFRGQRIEDELPELAGFFN